MEFEVANDFKVDDKMLGLEFENEFKVNELDEKNNNFFFVVKNHWFSK